ncbi:MAG: DNA polymerase, partial [Candidatus Bathyarchaeia archaeon]
MKSNSRSVYPREIVFFDTESRPVQIDETFQELRFWFGYAEYVSKDRTGCYQVKKSLVFNTADAFADFLEKLVRNRKTLYVMAHNIQHDLLTMKLLDILLDRDFELYGGYVEGTTFILRVRNRKGRVIFLDTYNFFHTSVEELGKLFGLEKVKLDLEETDYEKWLERCKKDVEIIRRAFTEFIVFLQKHNYGSWGLSIAGQAFRTFRHRFLDVKIHIHNDNDALQLERKAYGGGMVRCFKVGKFENGPYYKLDVNSEYPYVMAMEKYPVQLIKVWDGCTIEHLRELLEKGCVIADVIIDPVISIFRRRVPGKVIYPLYRFRTVMTTPELKLALELGCELKVNKIAFYRAANPFKRFMEEMYELRRHYKKEGNTVYATMIKYLMNSLSGKWGTRGVSLKILEELKGLRVKVDEWVDPDTFVHYKVYWIKDTPF